jgi:hypothetical protein
MNHTNPIKNPEIERVVPRLVVFGNWEYEMLKYRFLPVLDTNFQTNGEA